MAQLMGFALKHSSKANKNFALEIYETKLVKYWKMSKLDDGSLLYYFLYFLWLKNSIIKCKKLNSCF